MIFCHRYDNDHIYEEIPIRNGHPTNEETNNNKISDENPEVYSAIEEISTNARNPVYEEIKDETQNLDHAEQGNSLQGIVIICLIQLDMW